MTLTHYRSLTESDWLGQWDLLDVPSGKYREPCVVIASVARYAPRQRKQKRDPKTGTMRDEAVTRVDIGFKDKRKHWLCGRVSQDAIAALYGPHTERWIGKSIVLYVDPSIQFGKKVTGGIRVRPFIPNQAPSDDPLDNPVDEDARALQEAARDAVEKGESA